jgi:predicted RNA-binding Zn ribbon-like protein
MTKATLRRLRSLAGAHQDAARAAWRDAIACRQEFRALLSALGAARQLAPKRLAPLAARLARLPAMAPMVWDDGKMVHGLSGQDLSEPLWPVLWSMASLLAENRTARLGECQAPDCRYVFIDESRNQSLRWCSSDTCGNRERVRRAYHAER